jgi:HK97 gp10 family phage protein
MASGGFVGTPGIAGSRGSFRFTWRGAEVRAALEDAMQQAMQDTAEAAKQEAQSLAPVDTGLLRDSIYADMDARGGTARRTLTIGADAPYAAYVELGTGRAPAQPFIRPAVDKLAPVLTERLRAAIRSIR